MRYLKMLGLAAVAAMAVIAFVGAGTTSASTLCTANENPCSSTHTIKELKSSLTGGTAKLETTGGTVLDTCTGGEVVSNQERDGASASEGKITSLNWFGCTNTTDSLATFQIWEATGWDYGEIRVAADGTVTGRGTEVTVNGIFNSSCVYGTTFGGTTLGTFVSGSPATLSINAIVKKTSGGSLCPAETRWTASYQITNHTGAWVTAS